jgi:hypothetical protein
MEIGHQGQAAQPELPVAALDLPDARHDVAWIGGTEAGDENGGVAALDHAGLVVPISHQARNRFGLYNRTQSEPLQAAHEPRQTAAALIVRTVKACIIAVTRCARGLGFVVRHAPRRLHTKVNGPGDGEHAENLQGLSRWLQRTAGSTDEGKISQNGNAPPVSPTWRRIRARLEALLGHENGRIGDRIARRVVVGNGEPRRVVDADPHAIICIGQRVHSTWGSDYGCGAPRAAPMMRWASWQE